MREGSPAGWSAAIGLALAVDCVSGTIAAQTPTSIEADAYVALLPPAPDWECEPLTVDKAEGMGPGTVCERRPRGGRTVVAGVAEEFPDELAPGYANEPAAALLDLIDNAQAQNRLARGDEVLAFAPTATGHAAERAGAACSGYREETVDRRAGTREVARGLVCVDPRTRRPFRLVYLEAFPDDAAGPRPAFEAEADRFFEGFRFLEADASPDTSVRAAGGPIASSRPTLPGAPEPSAIATEPAAAPSARTAGAPPAGGFAIYLHSVRPADRVPGEWRRLTERHPDLADLELRPTQPVDVPGEGTLYRVLAGSFVTRAEAQAVCDRLRSRGQSCRVFTP